MSDLDVWLAKSGELKQNQRGTEYIDLNGDVVAKRCTNCKEMLSLNLYSRHKRKFGGRNSICKNCDGKRCREYYDQNREKRLESVRTYAENNREKRNKYNRSYREQNREKLLEYESERRDEKYSQNRNYYLENRDQFYLRVHQRRARKSALPDDLTLEQRTEILSNFNNTCALTSVIGEVHFDHVIPISVGHGGTTYGNMIPLRADLNISKSDNNIFEWFHANKKRFELSQERFNSLIEYLASSNAMTVDEYRKHVYWCHANPRDLADETDEEAI